MVVVGLATAVLVLAALDETGVTAFSVEVPFEAELEAVDCQPRLRESSYHQFLNIQPSKSVTLVDEPASMMKLVWPVGVQS